MNNLTTQERKAVREAVSDALARWRIAKQEYAGVSDEAENAAADAIATLTNAHLKLED